MPGIEKKIPLSLSLTGIKETGFSIRPDLREKDIDRLDWMIGFRPILHQDHSLLSVEVSAAAVNLGSGFEVASCSAMVTFHVEDIDTFVTKESETRINVRDQLMLNMLNPAYGTLRGLIHARFSGTLLENIPLPLIDVHDVLKAAKQ